MIGMMVVATVAVQGVAAQDAAARGIGAAMAASAAGWNANDLDRFMAVYAEDAVYVTAGGVVRGKPAIAARYRASFTGTANRRGRLSFQPLVERAIDPAHRLFIARWTLTGSKIETGMTSLLFERRGDAWQIVSDHSS